MRLKNFLIVVKDLEKSQKYYHDLFGFCELHNNDGNMILTDGLVLQKECVFKEVIREDVIYKNNASELYFEETYIEGFANKLERDYPDTIYINRLETLSFGQKMMRFYNLDGNLIELRTPMNMSR